MESTFWRKCSTCKKPIPFKSRYYVCSVSTCNGQRTGYVFCSIQCFDAHIPGARHRDAGAIEQTAPVAASASGSASLQPAASPSRRIITPSKTASSSSATSTFTRSDSQEVLVIASRLKDFINTRSGGFNTSASVIDVLSMHLRIICERAIENARAEGRKTVMDRDFEFLK